MVQLRWYFGTVIIASITGIAQCQIKETFMRMLTILLVLITVATGAFAQGVLVADFEGGTNNGDWTWGNGADLVNATGGNPDGWFGNDYINSFAPRLRCDWDTPGWTGDYVMMGVNRIQGDFQTLTASTEYMAYYPFCFMLTNHMGTPGDVSDDVYVYVDPNMQYAPDVAQGWVHYDFEIPSDFVGGPGELPAGWKGGSAATCGACFPADITWQDVLSDVGRVEVWFWDPDMFGVYEWFSIGADNIMLEWNGGPIATEESSFGSLKALYR